MDYYKELEIPHDASDDDIRKAYCRLALKYHPDKNHTPGATEKFTNISRAYEILSDHEKRRVYDAQMNEEPAAPFSFSTSKRQSMSTFYNDPFADFHFHTPEEIFMQFFHSHDPFSILGDPTLFPPTATTSFKNDPFFSLDPTSTFGVHMPVALRAAYGNFANRTAGGNHSSTRVTTTQFVNSNNETVTIKTLENDQGTKVIEDYGHGRRRVIVNGVEQENTLQQLQRSNSYLEGFGSGFQSNARRNKIGLPDEQQQQQQSSVPLFMTTNNHNTTTVLDDMRQNSGRRHSHGNNNNNNNEQDSTTSTRTTNTNTSIGMDNRNYERPINYEYIPGPQLQPTAGLLQTLKSLFCCLC